ncbi:hypothetical protein [Arsukibacterium sp.]|uniref:hypothetical protein n=1 Tax=Arsukibacterium sp. TaxID=1977258 RepID=UPI00299F4A11|nr:hypothetical protein [Arsukibacterium sp.]MDX1678245.1 hypothetical protein [Arsukibacterium sp.]
MLTKQHQISAAHLVRCRIADPTQDGFEALMAANPVIPCGDETASSTLLKQALDKHIKR